MKVAVFDNQFSFQIRGHMASLGIRKFQDLIGRTDLLRTYENNTNPKAKHLNLNLILKNALHMRPGVNIVGGSEKQVSNVFLIFKYLINKYFFVSSMNMTWFLS